MKNIYILPTTESSRLIIYSTLLNELRLLDEPTTDWKHKRHLYVTSVEEFIEEGDYGIDLDDNSLFKCKSKYGEEFTSELLKNGNLRGLSDYDNCRKIILTTDPTLITDGVQSIDDDFLKWFVENSSCEFVKTKLVHDYEEHPELVSNPKEEWSYYEITLPQEEPKQEILKDYDIKDNQIMLLKEDLECVHMYLDDLELSRSDNKGEEYSIVGRVKRLEERLYSEVKIDLLVNELINKFTNWSGSYVYRDKLIEIYEQLKKK